MRLRVPLIAYRVSIVWSPINVLDVISPSNAPPPVADDDEDAAEFRGAPPHEAPNAAIKKSARKRTARGEWVNDLNRIIECPFMIMVDEEAKRALVFDARFACALTAE
jgi:hypothetical protein